MARRIYNCIADLLLILLMSFSLVLALTDSAGFKYGSINMLLILFAFIVIWFIIFFNKTTLILTGLLSASALILSTAYVLYKRLWSIIFSQFFEILNWLYDYFNGTDSIVQKYMELSTILLCGIISLLLVLFTIKKFNFYIILIGGIALFSVQWILGFFTSKTSFYIFLFTILIYYLRWVLHRRSFDVPGEYAERGIFSFYVAPLCLAAVLISLLLPFSDKPLEWKWFDQKVADVYDFFTSRHDNLNFEYFSIGKTGFGTNTGKLGGKVSLDYTLAMTVKTDHRVYLKGTVRDTYLGNSWITNSTALTPVAQKDIEIYGDAKELVTGLALLSNGTVSADKLIDTIETKITYENLKTKTIFLPEKMNKFIPLTGISGNVMRDDYSMLSSHNTLGKGTSYIAESLSPLYGNEEFKGLLRKSTKGFYKNQLKAMSLKYDIGASRNKSGMILAIGIGDNIITINYNELEQLSEKAAAIQSIFTQLPDDLPDRIRQLTKSITANFNNDYDKVKAIEAYLSTNYPYTLNVPPTPKNRDFTDYFLFDLKKGYCTYYATAMTVMVRSLGIPARLSEGYMLPMKTEAGVYHVTNENAHAWVEVYFEGAGWLQFEPTSAFSPAFYSSSNIPQNISIDLLEDPEFQDYLSRIIDNMPEQTPELQNNTNEPESKGYIPYLFVGGIFFMAAFTIVILALINTIRRKYFLFMAKSGEPRKSILSMCERYIKMLSLQGYGIEPGETPSEYAVRLAQKYIFDNYDSKEHTLSVKPSKQRIMAVFDLFVIAGYSQEILTFKDRDFVFEYNIFLEDLTKSNLGKFRYFLYRYILGRF